MPDTDPITDPVETTETDAEEQVEVESSEGETEGDNGLQAATDDGGNTDEVEATPGTDQLSDNPIDAAPQDELLAAVPETFRAQIEEMREKAKNHDKRGAEWNREHMARLQAEKEIERYRQVHEDPDALKAEVEEARRYRESIQNRPPWDPHHPHHTHFMGLLQRGNEVGSRIQEISADPEIPADVKARLIQNEQNRLNPQEREHLASFQRATESHRLNPIGSTMSMLEQHMAAFPNMIRAEIERYQAEQAARQEVQEFTRSNPDALTKNADLLQRVLTAPREGKQFDVARDFVTLTTRMEALEAENNALKARLGDAVKTVGMAEAQIQASRSRATRTPTMPGGKGGEVDQNEAQRALRNGSLVQMLAESVE